MRVTVLDYGLGNIYSVAKALESIGASVSIADTADEIIKADRLVLPGVGSFPQGMRNIHEKKVEKSIDGFAKKGRPLLGICLGMQMLFSVGEEFGITQGLNFVDGRISRIKDKKNVESRSDLRLPHIGWSSLSTKKGGVPWEKSILRGFQPDSATKKVYFLHSYKAIADNTNEILAVCYYGNDEIVAAIQKDNILGCQFHPEKSGPAGLEILANFLRI